MTHKNGKDRLTPKKWTHLKKIFATGTYTHEGIAKKFHVKKDSVYALILEWQKELNHVEDWNIDWEDEPEEINRD